MSRYHERIKRLEKRLPPRGFDFEIQYIEQDERGYCKTDDGRWLSEEDYKTYCKANGIILITNQNDD